MKRISSKNEDKKTWQKIIIDSVNSLYKKSKQRKDYGIFIVYWIQYQFYLEIKFAKNNYSTTTFNQLSLLFD